MQDYNTDSPTLDDETIEQVNATDTFAEMPALEFVQYVTTGQNLAPELSDRKMQELSKVVRDRYEVDRESMKAWFGVMEKGLDLAAMTKGDKNYPYKNSSNIKYPLVTSAALQYNARAYPAIVPSGDPVQCQVHGEDPQGLKAARADRVGRFSSYQLKTKSPRWETDTDRLLFVGPIVGTMFRKWWFDPATQVMKSKLCKPGTVIVNNNISALEDAPAITEELELYDFEIETRRRTGWFTDDELQGEGLEDTKPIELIEQICRFDLDDDGYPEPYVVTMEREGSTIVRVASAFDLEDVRISEEGQILAIQPNSFFVDYHFLPSFDGTFMGHGLGALLNDISETVNTILNQLMDSGHYSTLGGGFIGAKDFSFKGGAARLRPGEYKPVNARGGDIRNAIVTLQYPQPSSVMFQLLGTMIDAGRELSSTSSIMTGDSANANMPVGTVMALIDQGMQVFSASYKRVHRSLTKEFKLLCGLNVRYLDPQAYTAFFDMTDEQGQPQPLDPSVEFNLDDMDITPVADHKSVTDMQLMTRAQFLLDLANTGMVDQAAAITRVLRAANIEDIEELMPQASPQDEMMQQVAMLSAQLDLRMKAATIDKDLATATAQMAKSVKDISSAEAEEEGRQLETYMKQMKAIKDELDIGQQMLQGQQANGGATPQVANMRPQGGDPNVA